MKEPTSAEQQSSVTLKSLWVFLIRHKKILFPTVAFGGVIAAILTVLGGFQILQAVDSPQFCTNVCHNVHAAEAVTYQASPHSQVACSSCHVGQGTENLIVSKIKGLKEILPTLTGNYQKPIGTPLLDRRPSDQTCEKCHSSDLFFGDVPQIAVRYKTDMSNTKTIETRVLKVGGGLQQVSSGIHWHTTGKVWYLALDNQRMEMVWLATEDTNGNITQYFDPARISQVTPEMIQKNARPMDCIDCHNRVTHLFQTPEQLIDAAITDGSIDAKLPFIKQQAMNALEPPNATVQQAEAKIAKIKDLYQTSYAETYPTTAASIDRAVAKLNEIAKLTIFADGPRSQTYPDNAKHVQPNADMTVDFAAITAADQSAGCFRCHGNLVKGDVAGKSTLTAILKGNDLQQLQSQPSSVITASTGIIKNASLSISSNASVAGTSSSTDAVKDTHPPGTVPAPNTLNAECDLCHYTPKSPLDGPLSPAISHPIDGLDDCLVCHGPTGARAFKAEHPWSTNAACASCHQSAPKLKQLTSKPPEKAREMPHTGDNLKACLVCHAPSKPQAFKAEHPWATDDTCVACHKAAGTVKPMPIDAPPEKAPRISHNITNLEACLVCHGPTRPYAFKQDHPWATNQTCLACHAKGPEQTVVVASAAQSPAITHSITGLSGCTACHSASGPKPYPPNHSGRPDSFCTICHQSSPTAAASGSGGGGGGGGSATTGGATDGGTSSTTADAAAVYASKCAFCHGANKQGASAPALDATAISTWTLAQMTTKLSTGSMGTYAIGTDVNALAQWLVPSASSTPTSSGHVIWTPTSNGFLTSIISVTSADANTTLTVPPGTKALTSAGTPLGTITVDPPTTDPPAPTNGNVVAAYQMGPSGATFSPPITVTVKYDPATLPPDVPESSLVLAVYDTTTSAWMPLTGSTVDTVNHLLIGLTPHFSIFGAIGTKSATPVTSDTIYASKCASCHGANRQGIGSASALTTTALSSRTLAYVTAKLTTGGSMSTYASGLTSAQINALAQWLKGTLPTVPIGLTATAVSAGQVNLSWTNSDSSVTGYTLQRATNNGFTANLMTVNISTGATNYSDSSCAGSTTYYYQVAAMNNAGSSAMCSYTTTTTQAATVAIPAAPTNLAATAISATQVNLTWTDSATNETGYSVQRDTNANFTNPTTTNIAASSASYSDTSATALTTYYYRVMAYNAGGNSTASNTATVTTPDLTPSAIYSTNCASCHGATLQGIGSAPALTATALSGKTLTYVTDKLTTGSMTSYASGMTSAQITVLAQWLKGALPAVPTGLTATPINAGQVNLAWTDADTTVTGYSVQRATNSGFTTGLTTFTVNTNTKSYSDTSTAGSTTYYYQVAAVNVSGMSAYSTHASALTQAPTITAPTVPVNLTATAASATQVNLTWTDNATNETGYSVQRDTNANFTNPTTTNIAANSTSYSDTGVTALTTYYYRVMAYNAGGNSTASNTATLTTPDVTPATLYLASGCGSCHGANLQGVSGPALTSTALTGSTLAQITAKLTTGSMATYASGLTSAQINALAQWLKGGTPAAVPTGLTATPISAGQVNLSWTDADTSISGYSLQRATNSGFTTGLVTFTVATNTKSYSDTTTVGSTTYYYQVAAVNPSGTSAYAAYASATTQTSTATIPTSPTTLAATTSATQVSLTWTDRAANETGYTVQRATDTAFTINLVTTNIAAASTAYIDTTIAASTTYSYRVFAFNSAGPSTASNVVTVMTGAPTTAMVYTTNCSACHGSSGQGTGIAPAVAGAAPTTTNNIVRNGVGTSMPAFTTSQISATSLTSLTTYVASLTATPTSGTTLFALNCAVCHGTTGLGTSIAPYLAGVTSSIVNSTTRSGLGTIMPAYNTTDISSTSLSTLATYVQNLGPAPTDGWAVYAEYCAMCHGTSGSGGSGGRIAGDSTSTVSSAVRNGPDSMPSFTTSQIGATALTNLSNYVHNLSTVGIYPTPTATTTPPPTTTVVSYSATIQPMFNSYCSCHIASAQKGVQLNNYTNVKTSVSQLPGMGSGYLTTAQEQTLALWISQGALNN